MCSAVIACAMVCERYLCTLRASAFRIEHGDNAGGFAQRSALACGAVAMKHVRRPFASSFHLNFAPTWVAAMGVSVHVMPCDEQLEVVQP